MKGKSMTFTTSSVNETEALGAAIARSVGDKAAFIALYGEMGAGKTALVRGVASVLSPGSRVKSPTYTIANEYRRGDLPLFHFDLCRLSSPEELDSFGFCDYIGRGHIVVEWAEIIGDELPPDAIRVNITKNGDQRLFEIDGIDKELNFGTGDGV